MNAVKKAWIILLAILALELVPFVLTIGRSPPGAIARLYGVGSGHWLPWGFAIAVSIAYVFYAGRAFPLIFQNLFTITSLKLAAIPFAIVTGTVEELYFRKFLMDWAAGHQIWLAGQVVLSALIFGSVHGVWGLFAKQWRMAFGAATATGALGGLLALVYLVAGRHVAPCVWAHMLINLAIEPWLILAAASRASSSGIHSKA